MAWYDNPVARIGLGIATGGGSELIRTGAKSVQDIQSGAKPSDTSALTEDQKRARALAESLAAERNFVHPEAQQFDAGQVAAAPQVVAGQVQAPTINDAQAQEIRARQLGALGTLESAANGTAPSVAAAQYQRNQQDIAQQAMGAAGQARGTAGIAARRDAIRAIQGGQQRASLDAALIRANEQAQGRGQLVGALSDVRGADTSMAQFGANQALQAGVTNAQLGQQASAQNAANTIGVSTGNVDRALQAARANQEAQLQSQQIANNYRSNLIQGQLQAGQQTGGLSEALLNAQQADRNRRVQSGAAILGGLVQGGAMVAGKG